MALNATNSRRAGDSTLVVSLCNTHASQVPRPSVLVVDLEGAEARGRPLHIRRRLRRLPGSRGLCLWKGLVCVAHEPGPRPRRGDRRPPPGFVLLDPRNGFRKVEERVLPTAPHSICEHDGELFFTASRQDSVYRLRCGERSRRWEASRVWTLPGSSGQEDENHLNGIEVVDGRLFVSAMGKKEPGSEPWASIPRGFVRDIEHEHVVMTDLQQPHSLLAVDGDLWMCQTRAGRVSSRSGSELEIPGGWLARVRGLAVDDRNFYIGVSKRRIGSSSQGTQKGWVGSCLIYRVDKETHEREVLVDLSDQADEIYELLLV